MNKTRRDLITEANALHSIAGKIATAIMVQNLPVEQYHAELERRWIPAWNRAVDFCETHNISKHNIR